MTKKISPTLRTYILRVVDQNSGGVKFTKLLAEVLPVWYQDRFQLKLDWFEDMGTEEIVKTILRTIHSIKGLKVLTYEYNFGNVTREKYFVYRKNTKKRRPKLPEITAYSGYQK
jgi:hypothetical protein